MQWVDEDADQASKTSVFVGFLLKTEIGDVRKALRMGCSLSECDCEDIHLVLGDTHWRTHACHIDEHLGMFRSGFKMPTRSPQSDTQARIGGAPTELGNINPVLKQVYRQLAQSSSKSPKSGKVRE